MKSVNKEIKKVVNAILTIEEIFAFDGLFDDAKDDKEREMKIKCAMKTLEEIANKKGITIEQLVEKTVAFVKKLYE
jgi:hypothetical protein